MLRKHGAGLGLQFRNGGIRAVEQRHTSSGARVQVAVGYIDPPFGTGRQQAPEAGVQASE